MPFLDFSDNLLQDVFLTCRKFLDRRTKHTQFWFGVQFPLNVELKNFITVWASGEILLKFRVLPQTNLKHERILSLFITVWASGEILLKFRVLPQTNLKHERILSLFITVWASGEILLKFRVLPKTKSETRTYFFPDKRQNGECIVRNFRRFLSRFVTNDFKF